MGIVHSTEMGHGPGLFRTPSKKIPAVCFCKDEFPLDPGETANSGQRCLDGVGVVHRDSVAGRRPHKEERDPPPQHDGGGCQEGR